MGIQQVQRHQAQWDNLAKRSIDWKTIKTQKRWLGRERTIENSRTKTCGDYSNNKGRTIKDATLGNRMTNWGCGVGNQNYKFRGRYKTISCTS